MDYNKGKCYWITGLSNSGKTTIGSALYYELKRKGVKAIILDGDLMKQIASGSENVQYYKHYHWAGIGIRTLADFYVMNRELVGMDRSYVNKELSKLGLTEFERGIHELAYKLISVTDDQFSVFDDLTDEERSMKV